MGVLAIASLAIGAVSAYEGVQARSDAQDAQRKSAAEQSKVQSEVAASNAQKRAEEARQQVREERIRRSKILQAGQNTGTAGSSGEFGAIGSLSTQLGSNLGANAASQQTAENISGYQQNAADFNLSAQQALNSASNADRIFNTSFSIFNAEGRAGAVKADYNKL